MSIICSGTLLNPLRDVIEWQPDAVYDVSGGDLQKALRLKYDSNPSIHEWCCSPIVEELVRVKKETSEPGIESRIPELDRYIREQIYLMQAAADKAENRKNDWEKLEEFFRSAVL